MKFIPIHRHPNYKEIEQKLKKLTNNLRKQNVLQILASFQTLVSKKIASFQQQKLIGKQKAFSYNPVGNRQNQIFSNNYQANQRLPNYNNHIVFQQNRLKQHQRYKMLQRYDQKQINNVFGFLAMIVLSTKDTNNIPILEQNMRGSVDLNKDQVLYLMALMAMNLVPPQNYDRSTQFNKQNNFCFIFQQQEYKTRTIMEYFIKQMQDKDNSNKIFSIIRESSKESLKMIIDSKGNNLMRDCSIMDDSQSIDVQKFNGMGKVDFANKKIGGGALTKGCVQQEIMFANHPEMYISILLCESMREDEALLFIGFKKYFKNYGYSYETQYAGEQRLKYEILNGRALEYIIAIDATHFTHNAQSQFDREMIDRQIKKAYIGFNMLKNVKNIVTGNWGCGAFKGEVCLKFIIQWIASSLANKQLLYCPFGQSRKIDQFSEGLYNKVKMMEVNYVYNLLIKAAKLVRSQHNNVIDLMFGSAKSIYAQKKGSSNNYGTKQSVYNQRNAADTLNYYQNSRKDFKSVDPSKKKQEQTNYANQRSNSAYKKKNINQPQNGVGNNLPRSNLSNTRPW